MSGDGPPCSASTTRTVGTEYKTETCGHNSTERHQPLVFENHGIDSRHWAASDRAHTIRARAGPEATSLWPSSRRTCGMPLTGRQWRLALASNDVAYTWQQAQEDKFRGDDASTQSALRGATPARGRDGYTGLIRRHWR